MFGYQHFGLTRGYFHYQYCVADIAIQDGRGKPLYCAVVWAVKGGGGRPKQRECLRIIVLILVRRPRTKRIPGEGQAMALAPHSVLFLEGMNRPSRSVGLALNRVEPLFT